MQLVLIQFLFFTLVLKNVFLTSAMDIYVQPGTDVTIPCSINITPSNIQALYWQKVTNSTEGFETLYSFSKFTDLGWQSPVRGYVVNHTDLVLLNVSFSHDGIYKCRLLTHSKVEIKETSAYLHVILPLSEIKISKATTGDVITDGAVIEVLHGEETDVECAVVGKVYPPVSLRLQTSANNINASIARVRSSSSAAKLNISQLARVQNITCRADQIVAGRSYKTVEATFTIKRLDPRIAIANCLDPIDSHPGDCCVISASSNVSKISDSIFNLSCEAQNTATPWDIKLFRVSDDQVDEEEESSFDGYAISVVDVPIDKNSKWLCVATHSLDESINRSICVETTDSPAVGYGKSNLHKRHLIIGSTFAGLVIIITMIVLIVFFIKKRRARSTVFKAYDPDYTYNIIAPSIDMDNPPLNDQGPAIWSRLPLPPPPSLRAPAIRSSLPPPPPSILQAPAIPESPPLAVPAPAIPERPPLAVPGDDNSLDSDVNSFTDDEFEYALPPPSEDEIVGFVHANTRSRLSVLKERYEEGKLDGYVQGVADEFERMTESYSSPNQ